MPIEEPLFYKRNDDYADQFRELLSHALGDRLRSNRVSVFLSGGLDSPTLAAVARDLLRQRYPAFALRAVTEVDPFVPDEQHYAGLVATHLSIPIDYEDWTDVRDFDWERIPFGVPEPSPGACLIPSQREFWNRVGNYSRVFFHAEGPDNALLLDWRPYTNYLFKHKQYELLARSALATVMSERRPPFWGRICKNLRIGGYSRETPQPNYPAWLNPRLEFRLKLRERWQSLNSSKPLLHPLRPQGYASLQIPRWQAMFEGFDFGVTQCSFEVRHPFLDIRMLRFLLAVPPLPWCRSKYLIRKSMQGRLPKAVLSRKKAAPDMNFFRNFLAQFCEAPFRPALEIHEFVDVELFSNTPLSDPESNVRLRSLNHWLQNSYPGLDNDTKTSP
jgi:asparagine synthase (glutamine-hydrolysing)